MSKTEIELCSLLLKENFGEIVQKVGKCLMGYMCGRPLMQIVQLTALPREKVQQALRVLIWHHFCHFEENQRGFVEYRIEINQILFMLHYPRYIYCAKLLYGDAGELLVEELLKNGRISMSGCIQNVVERLQEAINQDYTTREIMPIKEKFVTLVQTRFVQRCPFPSTLDSTRPIPVLSVTEKEMYIVPEIKLYLLEKIRGTESTSEKANSEEFPDKDIYWRINIDRFHQYFRDDAVISAVSNVFDKKASLIIRTMLRMAETRSDPWAANTNAVARFEILDVISKETTLEDKELNPYLSVLTDEEQSFVSKVEDRAGGMYVVNTKQAVQRIVEANISCVVRDRFGDHAHRIFRLLLQKKYLEQREIEKFALVAPKDAKELTYSMMIENFIIPHEIPKSSDLVASRTFHLFHVDINQVCYMLLQWCYKAISNALYHSDGINKENKRLLEKKQRVDAIVATLQQSGAEAAQVEEVEQMITPVEQLTLKDVKRRLEKLEACQIQLAETVVLYKIYLDHCITS